MSGDAFVVGDRLVVDQRALCEVGGGDDDAAGALAVRSAGDVVGCSGGLESGYGFDGDRRLGKQGEELREVWAPSGRCSGGRSSRICSEEVGMYLGFVLSEARKEARSAKPSFLAMARHLGLDAVDLAETELVDLVRRHVGRGPGVDVVLVALLAVWQREVTAERGTAVRGVFRAQEGGEGPVSGNDVDVDGVGDLLGQALLVFEGNVRRILFCRKQKRIGVDDALTLDGKLLQEESDGHELVLHASAKDFGGLAEDAQESGEDGRCSPRSA